MKRRPNDPMVAVLSEAFWALQRKINAADEPGRGTLADGWPARPAPRPPRSRTGPLPLAKQDEPLVADMHELIKSGAARSVSAAAKMMASKAVGAGSETSKAKRLERHYGKRRRGYH